MFFVALYDDLLALEFPPGRHATDDLKRKLLQPNLLRNVATGPLIEGGKSRRPTSFDISYVKKYSWLMVGDKGIVCIYCKLFLNSSNKPNRPGGLLSKPWVNYSKKITLDNHNNPKHCKYHDMAQTSAQAFWASVIGKRPSINHSVAGKAKEVAEVRNMTQSITIILALAAKQGMPLRGHRLESVSSQDALQLTKTLSNGDTIVIGDKNGGNFKALLRHGISCGDKHLQEIPNKPSTYTSPRVQNELIQLLASEVRSTIVKQIGRSVFSVIADETTDVSTTEQLCVAIRYVDFGDEGLSPQIQERFLSFRKMTSMTGT